MGAERDVWAGIRFTCDIPEISSWVFSRDLFHKLNGLLSSAETSDPSGRRLKSLNCQRYRNHLRSDSSTCEVLDLASMQECLNAFVD
ncbi:hypothetical protein FOBRF1_004995 [Fusarium oxysporum]